MGKFHQARLIICNFGAFRNGAAMALPGIGIFVGKISQHDEELLRHEYGHYLQAQKWGYWFFYTRVALSSLTSAWRRPRHHRFHWTEWTANYLSRQYFSEVVYWDYTHYPIAPPESIQDIKNPFPSFCQEREVFYAQYLQCDDENEHHA